MTRPHRAASSTVNVNFDFLQAYLDGSRESRTYTFGRGFSFLGQMPLTELQTIALDELNESTAIM